MERILSPLRKAVPDSFLNAIRKPYHFAWALLGNLIYRFPGRKLKVIGVTGTKGKSTTSYLAAKVLESGGLKVGLISGVMMKMGEEESRNTTSLTTLGRLSNPRLLRKMVKAGCTHVVIEVTSHALNQSRVWGIPFETAVLTNFSPLHMELHGTVENYRAAKGKLFQKLRQAERSTSIVNGESKEAPYFLEFFADSKFVFGTSPEVREILPLARNLVAEDVKLSPAGSSFAARNDETVQVKLNLPGEYNVENALAAVAVGLAYGIEPEKITAGIAAVKSVPGRLEPVEAGQPFKLYVDFAHTPDSYETVLKTLREITRGRLIAVLGAYGDRDDSMFPKIGKSVAEYADHAVLTEDDPGSRDPADQNQLLIKGIESAGPTARLKRSSSGAGYEVELDRRKAIRRALQQAKRGDTVALLGKGAQLVMRYKSGSKPWNEAEVAAEEWRKLVSKG